VLFFFGVGSAVASLSQTFSACFSLCQKLSPSPWTPSTPNQSEFISFIASLVFFRSQSLTHTSVYKGIHPSITHCLCHFLSACLCIPAWLSLSLSLSLFLSICLAFSLTLLSVPFIFNVYLISGMQCLGIHGISARVHRIGHHRAIGARI
jgi:hypothetical protein